MAFEQKQSRRCPVNHKFLSHREWSSPPCCSAAVGGKACVLSHRGRSETSKESKDPVVDVGVGAEYPVVGPLVVAVPSAAPVPARVEHLVGKVLGSRAQSSSPSRGVNGLVAREEPGVWLVLVSPLWSVPGQAGSVLGGRGGEDEEGGKDCEREICILLIFTSAVRQGW